MPTVYLQDGIPLVENGAIAISDACCCDGTLDCPCPDLSTLCVSVALIDTDGNTRTADQDDFFWDEGGTSGTAYLGGFEYGISISCVAGSLLIAAGWTGLVQNCNCTNGSGGVTWTCTQQTQSTFFLGTATFDILLDDPGGYCDETCPETVGSVTITISEPPC